MQDSIRRRLGRAFVGLALCPVLVVEGVVACLSFGLQRGRAIRFQYERAQRVAAEVRAFVHELDRDLDVLIEVRGIQELHVTDQELLLAQLLSYQNMFDELAVLDSVGQEQVRLSRLETVTPGDLRSRADDNAFRAPKNDGATYFSPIEFDEATGDPLMTLAKPLVDTRSGEVGGVLVARIRFKSVWNLIADIHVEEGESVFIVDAQSRVIAHRDRSVVLGGTRFKLPESAGFHTGLSSRHACLAFYLIRFGNQEFAVVVEQSLYNVMAPFFAVTLFVGGFVILPTLLIALFVAGRSTRRIVGPIQALSAAAEAIEGGDLSRRAEVVTEDEIGDLSESFNSMTAQLRASLESLEQEVAERRQAEEALRVSEQRYRILVENLSQSVLQKDRDSVFVSCNAAFARGLGVSLEEITGKTDHDFYPKDLAEKYRADDQRIMARGVTEEIDERHVQRGREMLVRVVKTPLRDEDGNVTGLLAIFWDITERKKAEQALRESEARYRLLAENVSDVIWTMDLDLNFTYISPSVEAMEGYTIEEAMARRIEDYMTPESYKLARKTLDEELAWQRAHPGDVPRTRMLELEQYRKDGTLIWAEMTMSFLCDANNQPVGILGITRDITQRKRLQAQIQHAQKLESLGVLAGGIAHDFNNLLMGILGNASLALMELRTQSKARHNVEQIETAAMRAAELSRQMLAYSGKGKFVIEPICISSLVEEMTHLLGASISKKAVLKYHFADNLPLIEGDATQLRQVIMNLITNASEAIGDKSGIITVGTGVMEADQSYLADTYVNDELPRGSYVYLEVSDTGCGMDQETQKKIFDPFFTKKFMGRGLGLAAVLGIIRGHNGAIKVYSEVGKGSTVKVLFPCSTLNSKAVLQATKQEIGWRGSGTILVVDDEQTVRAVAKMILEEFGFDVLTANDGAQAVEVFREHAKQIDAVLLDMTMPRLSGEEVFTELRRIRPDVPVVLSSGYNEEEATARFTGKGLAGFLQKPYRPNALIQKLRELLSKEGTSPHRASEL